MRERGATELLAQAEGASQNFESALQLAARTLELSRALKFEQVLPIDLYNLGFFNFALNKPSLDMNFIAESSAGSIHPRAILTPPENKAVPPRVNATG